MGFMDTTEAKRLKHVFSVLRMATTKVVFEIDEIGLHSSTVVPGYALEDFYCYSPAQDRVANVMITTKVVVDPPGSVYNRYAYDRYARGNYYALTRNDVADVTIKVDLVSATEQASANELIGIGLNEYKPVFEWGAHRIWVINISTTSRYHQSGRPLKEIVAKAMDVGGEALQIAAAICYAADLPCLTKYELDGVCVEMLLEPRVESE